MSLTVADVDRWDPGAVRAVAAIADRRSRLAAAASERVAGLPVTAGWTGIAAASARDAFGAAAVELAAVAAESAAIARAAERAADGIARIRSELRDLDTFAAAAGLAIDRPDGTVTSAGRRWSTDGSGESAALRSRLTDLLRRATALDADLAAAIVPASGPRPRTPAQPDEPQPDEPLAGSAPADVNRWWRTLTPAEQADLAANGAGRIGNLDGVPTAVRDAANRAVLAADLGRVADAAARHGETVGAVLADPEHYGLTETAATRYTNALHVRNSLQRNAAHTGTDTLLLIYRPEEFGGQGRAAIAIGNPDTAAHTAVLVPGTGSTVASWIGDESARALFAEVTAASDLPAAVVAYMGYDAPDSILDPRVATPDLARRGGALLAADVNALGVTAGRGTHLTVIGHSYGATTVADAAALHGMQAHDVVLVGSPGTDTARSAADFGLRDGGHVYVGAASTDVVTSTAGLPRPLPIPGGPLIGVGLGADPAADGFGSTRFKAEAPGFTAALWEEHSRYFDPGSESLYSIADVVSGRGEALQEHGMTAPHRTGLFGRWGTELGLPSWSSPLADPELRRPATTGHFH